MSGSNPGFSSNKPTNYLLDYADLKPETINALKRNIREAIGEI